MYVDFFFQAEDGIRDYKVTGVQTCALPIWLRRPRRPSRPSSPHPSPTLPPRAPPRRHQIGRASCRERVEISVVAVVVKKQTKTKQAETSEREAKNTQYSTSAYIRRGNA